MKFFLSATHTAFDVGSSSDIDHAFAVLRRCGERIAQVQDPDWTPKSSSIKLSMGQIFRHKKHGFRGVVVECFESCPADQNWSDKYGPFERGTDQPFYRTLIDTKDRPRPFMALAAEENLIPLDEESVPVEHPLMGELFSGFEHGRHVLREELQAKYPDEL